MSTAYLRGVAWAESTLTPLAERILTAIEDPPEQPLQPKTPVRDLESELLQGGHTPSSSGVKRVPASASAPAEFITVAEAQQLRSDCDALLQQRERLRAQLIAEQERRERAEAELVAVGAQWLGTETQAALRKRAEAEKKRELEAARSIIQREANQRVAKLEVERSLLLEKLGEKAPTKAQLRAQLRAALQQELECERREARDAVRERLETAEAERDRLLAAMRAAEATHRTELELLRASVRKASELMSEQYDKGFVLGLKEAASALAPPPPAESPRPPAETTAEPRAEPQARSTLPASPAPLAPSAAPLFPSGQSPTAPSALTASSGGADANIAGGTDGGGHSQSAVGAPSGSAPPQPALLAGLQVRSSTAAPPGSSAVTIDSTEALPQSVSALVSVWPPPVD